MSGLPWPDEDEEPWRGSEHPPDPEDDWPDWWALGTGPEHDMFRDMLADDTEDQWWNEHGEH